MYLTSVLYECTSVYSVESSLIAPEAVLISTRVLQVQSFVVLYLPRKKSCVGCVPVRFPLPQITLTLLNNTINTPTLSAVGLWCVVDIANNCFHRVKKKRLTQALRRTGGRRWQTTTFSKWCPAPTTTHPTQPLLGDLIGWFQGSIRLVYLFD